MCGIAGLILSTAVDDERKFNDKLAEMAATLSHRGPDSFGHWSDAERGVGLSHRRLKIVDLTDAGGQPMHSVSGRHILVFNGEIYNHQSIRKELDMLRVAWRGHSDSETFLAAIEYWGLSKALSRTVGMFAFALWDREAQELFLVRDRLGVKPLYWGNIDGGIAFASELKAFHVLPTFKPRLDPEALGLQLRYRYLPSPLCIFQNCHKVVPGTIVHLRRRMGRIEVGETRYWSSLDTALAGRAKPFTNRAQALEEAERLLDESIGLRMVADVPVGAFLSGGIDSSLVVATMQKISTRPIKTFTIGFTEPRYDESGAARAVANYLGTEHRELIVTPNEAMEVIPDLPRIYDEPLADVSQIPTILVSRLARQEVIVSLSGDGGDELFYGYDRYRWAQRLSPLVARLPARLRQLLAIAFALPGRHGWHAIIRFMRMLSPAWPGGNVSADKILKGLEKLDAEGIYRLYDRFLSPWPGDANPLRQEPLQYLDKKFIEDAARFSYKSYMMYVDQNSYLPDDIMAKVDRASMSVGLEAREPLLDHRIVEFAWRVPEEWQYHRGRGKQFLRELLYRRIPRELADRPKQGFDLPIGEWIRGPLREWAEELLAPAALNEHELLDVKLIRRYWREHLEGIRNWQTPVWNILMFQTWRKRWLP